MSTLRTLSAISAVIAGAAMLACPAFGQGARFPNMRWVQPDPNSGRPVLIHTSCGSPEDGPESWATPISVYSDSDVEIFVDHNCVVASAQMGFAGTGRYSVNVVTFYKGDAFCRIFTPIYSPADHPNPGFIRECRSIAYKSRHLSVDTQAKTMQTEDIRLED